MRKASVKRQREGETMGKNGLKKSTERKKTLEGPRAGFLISMRCPGKVEEQSHGKVGIGWGGKEKNFS